MDEIQVISDGDGLAVIGAPEAVDIFLGSAGLPSKDLGLHRLGSVLATSSGVAHAGAQLAENSGRWVQLTEKSAAALKQYPQLMKGSADEVSRTILTQNGKITESSRS